MHDLRSQPSAARLVWHATVRTHETNRAGLPAQGPAAEATGATS